MLTIQPKLQTYYQTSFKSNRKDDIPMDIINMDDDQYDEVVDELEEQRDNFEDMASDDKFKLPEPAKKVMVGGAIVTTGLLGGMAAGWGTKKSIQGFRKLAKTAPVQNIKSYLKDTGSFAKATFKSTKESFLKSDVYLKPANAISRAYKNFGKTRFGGHIVDFLNSVGRGIKKVYKAVKKAFKDVFENLKSVKKEKYENAAINTVGVSGGVSSGVMALKEQQGDN